MRKPIYNLKFFLMVPLRIIMLYPLMLIIMVGEVASRAYEWCDENIPGADVRHDDE